MFIENAQKCHHIFVVTTKQLNWIATLCSSVERSHGWVIIMAGLSTTGHLMAHLGLQSHGRCWPGNCAQVARQLVISQYCSFSAADHR